MTDRLAEDWMALWRSELTAMAADRELRESVTAMLVLWAGSANAALGLARQMSQVLHDAAPRTAGTVQPAGAAPAIVASEPGMDEIERLNRRIAELEQRIGGLEPGGRQP